MVDDDGGDGSFKRPGAVPFNWEIRPGIPKTATKDDVPTLLQPPKKLHPLRLQQLSPPSSPRPRAVSPFAPPPPYVKPKPPSASGPPSPYWRSSSARGKLESGSPLRRWRLLKSLIGLKKSIKSRDVKKKDGDQDLMSSQSDEFYESGTTFSQSEGSSRGSVGTSWSSPHSSLSSSSSSLKRNESDLSSSEKKVMLMMARAHLG
ncbi:unnamed protein product [Brassica oleracea]|uniref:Uncharacterized protein n=1 Tax=Brassica oleracea TaxID=3712 RepID=A0A3P6FK06_BRAOL|nr:unnamed protein product [Brassica oleracea]